MPTKPTENKPVENSEEGGQSIDPQKKYLMDQFGNLMEQVGDGFGGPLQEELIKRLEQTIADFHEEVTEMMTSLTENAEKRHEKLKEIWNNPDAVVENNEVATENTSSRDEGGDTEMSEWEKRLEQAGKLGEGNEKSADVNEAPKDEPPKKKGLFGRKKK